MTLRDERVWPLVTRIWHWALAACVIAGWSLGEFRDFATIRYHFYVGYAIGALIVFRVMWGVFGPPSARLGALLPRPGDVLAYLRTVRRREPSHLPGHNPLGALSVLAMLAALAVQVASGLCAEDDGLFSAGPLAGHLPSELVITLTAVHSYSSRVVLALVTLHVGAVLFYLVWKRENLIRPMITGWKSVRR